VTRNFLADENELPYNPELGDVWRFEVRFHQSVVQQFVRGIKTQSGDFEAEFNRYSSLAKHFTGFWRKALMTFRLDYSRYYIHPFWQFLRDDVYFYDEPPLFENYYRVYLEASQALTFQQVERVLKSLVVIYHKLGWTPKKNHDSLIACGLIPVLSKLYADAGLWWKSDNLLHSDYIFLPPHKPSPVYVYP
jgi:hypothetical protein